MKRIIKGMLTVSIFIMLTVLSAEMKEKKGDDFLRVNDNIQNQELRIELKGLREEFNIERIRIQEYYNEKMEALKAARGNDVKTLKTDFAERRAVLMKKYFGKMRKKPPIGTHEPVKNAPGKKKVLKDKKIIRKPK